MYKLGRLEKHKRKIGRYFVLIAIVATSALYFIFFSDAVKNTEITLPSTKAVSRDVKAVATETMVEEPNFSLKLPEGWRELDRQSNPYRYVEWRDGTSGSSARTMRVYQDSIPKTLPINRVLPVVAQGPVIGVGEAST